MSARASLLLLTTALAAAISGCGYSTGSLTRRIEQRVHVPIFENRTFWRDIEVALTQQVEKELASRPGISIAPPERADIVLAGTIVDYEQRVLSENPGDQVRESSVVTRVRIEVKDARTGAVRRTYEVRDRAEFLAAAHETLATATSESFFDLARAIVNGLEDDFPRASPAARSGAAGKGGSTE